MNKKIVVTNLRIPIQDWLLVKSMAGELGISVNEYLNMLIQESSGKKQLGIRVDKRRRSEKQFWDIPNIMKGKYYKPMGASEEDKIIYGIEDD